MGGMWLNRAYFVLDNSKNSYGSCLKSKIYSIYEKFDQKYASFRRFYVKSGLRRCLWKTSFDLWIQIYQYLRKPAENILQHCNYRLRFFKIYQFHSIHCNFIFLLQIFYLFPLWSSVMMVIMFSKNSKLLVFVANILILCFFSIHEINFTQDKNTIRSWRSHFLHRLKFHLNRSRITIRKF